MYLEKELLVHFNVHQVDFDPVGYSDWYISFNNGKKFWAMEQEWLTEEEDKFSKEVEAQIMMSADDISQSPINEKSYTADKNGLSITGVYSKAAFEEDFIIVDSVFPVKVLLSPKNNLIKKGEWVKITGITYLTLAREHNIN